MGHETQCVNNWMFKIEYNVILNIQLLTHCGLVTPNSDTDLGQHELR